MMIIITREMCFFVGRITLIGDDSDDIVMDNILLF